MRSNHWLYLIIAAALLAVALAATASAADIPSDWDVSGHVPMSSDTLNVYGNITVLSGGHLDLTDIDIVMKCAFDGQYTLKVNAGGKLTMDGGSVKAETSSSGYKFEIHGEATLEGIEVADTWATGSAFDASGGSEPDLSGLRGGVQIYSDDVYIGNSTLHEAPLCMVYVSQSSPRLFGNDIEDVYYRVKHYSQTTGDPSDTDWSAMAFGVLLDDSPAKVMSNDFSNIGVFTSMASVYYRDSSVNDNSYQVIAAAVAARDGTVDLDTNTVASTGTLTKTSDNFVDGGNTVRQSFSHYRVAGVYGYNLEGCTIKTNDLRTSEYGLFIVVDPSTSGAAMVFDVIVDNVLKSNDLAGAYFHLSRVSRAVTINVEDNDIDENGEGSTSALEDNGLVVFAQSCTADLTVSLKRNNVRDNHARGVYVDVHDHDADVVVHTIETNTFDGNGGAALLVSLDSVVEDVDFLVENSTFLNNDPARQGDPGAVSLTGGGINGDLSIKLADAVGSSNTGSGLGIDLGGVLSVNLATTTSYKLHQCQFNGNSLSTGTSYGIYIFDSYGANAQQTTFEIFDVQVSNNDVGLYLYSNSQLGNIGFNLDSLVASDCSETNPAVHIALAANSFNPRATLRDVRVTYSMGPAAGATGLFVQGVDATKRWKFDLRESLIAEPGTALEANFCDIKAYNCNLTGVGVNSILARDSIVDLYYCDVPDLSAQTSGGVNAAVRFYMWFNVSLVSWQNKVPIDNQTITIKRYREPKEEVYTGQTNADGNLTNEMIPFWERDSNNNPLRNDELQAFMTIKGETINSLRFDFNATRIGLEDPDVPDLNVKTPSDKTVQKSGTITIQGEVRDAHSGIKEVEATIDNIVWHKAEGLEKKEGYSRASFSIPIYNLTDGVYTITIRGWDVARYKNESFGVALWTIKDVKIDTQPPFLDILRPGDAFNVTNERVLEIVGKTELSVNIAKLTINDEVVPIAGNTFSQQYTLVEGTNVFVIIAEDTAGNIAVATRQVVFDDDPPALIITSPTDLFSSSDQDFEIAGDTEQDATVYVRLDEGGEQKVEERGGTRFYYVLTIRREGFHDITIISKDKAKNREEKVVRVKYDTTPPILEDIVPAEDGKPTNQQVLYVSGRTDEEVRQVTVNGQTHSVSSGRFALDISLLEGEQDLVIEVYDAAGNYNFTTRKVFIDVTPPNYVDFAIRTPEPEGPTWEMEEGVVVNRRSVRFWFKLEESDKRTLMVNVGGDNRSALQDPAVENAFYRDFNLAEGQNIVEFFAIDVAGNRRVVQFKVNVDTSPPTLVYYSPKMSDVREATLKDDTVLISGKVEGEVGAITMMVGGRQVQVNPETRNFQVLVPLEEGENNVPVEVTDRAGNTFSEYLHLTYETEEAEDDSLGRSLKEIWWLFAILIGLLIIIPITVQVVRARFYKEHPELADYNPKKQEDAYYDDGYDQYGGGGY